MQSKEESLINPIVRLLSLTYFAMESSYELFVSGVGPIKILPYFSFFIYFMAATRTKLIIVPRWAGTPSSDWYPWIQGELAKHSPPIERVDVADMPNPTLPTIENWVGHLEKNFTDQVDENTIIIGHSVGNQSILRFLEKISKQGKPHFSSI